MQTLSRVGVRSSLRRYHITSTRRRCLSVVNPATGKIVKELKEDTRATVSTNYNRARAAQKLLATIPLQERAHVVRTFADKLEQHAQELATTLTQEMGKPLQQALNEIRATPARVRFFADNVVQALQPKTVVKQEGLEELITREPLGVIANISAWNYPYFVGTNVFVPALLTGNAVLYKASEYTTLTGARMVELMHESGIPKDAFINIVGSGEIGSELLNQPINGVFFTGSYKTGAAISEIAGRKMIKAQLELGGKDPIYVHSDVDVKKAAEATADGAFYNCGQSCCSVERIYVHESVYDSFVSEFVATVKSFKIGDPMNLTTYLGPLARPQHVKFLEAQVSDAIAKGGRVLLGGSRLKQAPATNVQATAYFEPTVIVNVNHSMDLMKEETFGPVIGIQKVKSVDEAIQLMNDSSYGLTAGIYTKDQQIANKVLDHMESGTVYWNCCDRVSPHLPWLGRKHSGLGLTLSVEGITTFTVPKAWHKRSS